MIMLFQWKMWHKEYIDYQNNFAHHCPDISNDVIKFMHMICEIIGSNMFVSMSNDG